ncbi:hypothetical protein B0H13DRAFT_2274881 [Mycena leptocephala]|nr:hypothetical protein B0H13DRAFT_2274881 [Mycena leptocephala]
MNRQPGPSRSAAAHTTGSNQYSNPYDEGAPHGDPFNVPAPTGGPVFCDARSFGHGPVMGLLLRLHSNTPRAFRSTSLDTSRAFPRHGAALNRGRTASQPVYDPSLVTTPTPNRYNIPSRPPAVARPQFVIPEERTQMEHLLDMMVPGRHWPDPTLVRRNPITQELYPTPVFGVNVSDPQNHALFRQVGQQAFTELEDRECWPQGLRRPSQQVPPTWDFAYAFELTKNSFCNLKKQWNEPQKIEVAIQGDTNRRTNRHLKRRQRSQKLTKILYAFAAKHGLDRGFLADLLHEQFLSDEASRPEDDSNESNDAWKVRLASAAGLTLDPEAQHKMKALEILKPAWRSESYAPYNFGISPQWWSENSIRPANKTLLKDWNKYPEPEDCGLVMERDANGTIVDAHFSSGNE